MPKKKSPTKKETAPKPKAVKKKSAPKPKKPVEMVGRKVVKAKVPDVKREPAPQVEKAKPKKAKAPKAKKEKDRIVPLDEAMPKSINGMAIYSDKGERLWDVKLNTMYKLTSANGEFIGTIKSWRPLEVVEHIVRNGCVVDIPRNMKVVGDLLGAEQLSAEDKQSLSGN